jgi:ribonuclease HI
LQAGALDTFLRERLRGYTPGTAIGRRSPAPAGVMTGGTLHRPADGVTLICYADGASRGNPGPAAIGGVVVHPSGTVLREISEPIGRATNNVAEWRAAVAVLDAARGLGARVVELCLDSELVVRQIEGRYTVRSATLLPHYRQALTLLSSFDRYTVRHIPRAQNAQADRLANAALDRRRD